MGGFWHCYTNMTRFCREMFQHHGSHLGVTSKGKMFVYIFVKHGDSVLPVLATKRVWTRNGCRCWQHGLNDIVLGWPIFRDGAPGHVMRPSTVPSWFNKLVSKQTRLTMDDQMEVHLHHLPCHLPNKPIVSYCSYFSIKPQYISTHSLFQFYIHHIPIVFFVCLQHPSKPPKFSPGFDPSIPTRPAPAAALLAARRRSAPRRRPRRPPRRHNRWVRCGTVSWSRWCRAPGADVAG